MKREQLTLFKVRDLRKKTQYKIDDTYLNSYARVCKPVATAVYNSLCRHAEFHSQKAFPSQELMARQHSISVATVKRALKRLASHNIILIEQEKMNGKFKNNVYTLLDKSEWRKVAPVGHQRPTERRRSSAVGHSTVMVKWSTKDNKVLKDNKYTKDNKAIVTQSVTGKELNSLIDLFKAVNPSYERLFSNKSQRAALERLVAKYGGERVAGFIGILEKTNTMPFSPTITTPIVLEHRLGDLIAFYRKERVKIEKKKPTVAKIR